MSRKSSSVADRLPPHDTEAEQGVLGCIILSPAECLAECVEHLGEVGSCFYDLRHQVIYDTLTEMFDKSEQIDLITLQRRLKDKQKLDSIGGLSYLSSLPDKVPSASNLEYYLEIVREKFALRKMLGACSEAVQRIYEHQGEVDPLLDQIERDILRIRNNGTAQQMPPVKTLVHEAVGVMENLYQKKGAIDGLATGFIDLDRLTGGLHPGEMAIIAGNPSAGKTSLAINIAEHVVLQLKEPVGVFSLEMTSIQLVLKFICSHARVNLRNIRDGFLSERDFPKLTSAAGKLSQAAIYFDDTSDLSIFRLRAKARRMHQQHKIKLFIIDYLQLLNAVGGSRRLENRQQEVADISNGIKSMAKELRVPVIVLSQLNDDGKLRESRAPGQDTDHLWMLRRSEKEEDRTEDAEPMSLAIAKNRNGPRDVTVPLIFLKSFTRFESAAKVAANDVPSEQETMNYNSP